MSTSPSNEPFCANCGHQLTGLVDSSKCPECGKPLVEVLSRGGMWGKRFTSRATLFGLPVVSVAYGPAAGERIGHARGVIALGDRATGIVALGGRAVGVVAAGGVAAGVFSIGGLSLGLVTAWGGLAIAALACGGVAAGVLTQGGLGLGFVATGGLAAGWYALGGMPLGVHTMGPAGSAPEAQEIFAQLSWFFGSSSGGFGLGHMVQPTLIVLAAPAAVAALVALLAIVAHARAERAKPPEP